MKWFTLAEAAEIIGLPVEVLTEAANKNKLITRCFNNGNGKIFTTDEELARWSKKTLYSSPAAKKLLKTKIY